MCTAVRTWQGLSAERKHAQRSIPPLGAAVGGEACSKQQWPFPAVVVFHARQFDPRCVQRRSVAQEGASATKCGTRTPQKQQLQQQCKQSPQLCWCQR